MESNKSAKKGETDSNPAEQSAEKKDFLTVGIGAAAGGIKALKEFFAAMPSDSGMAFVVTLHLSEEHESMLADLQSNTAMGCYSGNGNGQGRFLARIRGRSPSITV